MVTAAEALRRLIEAERRGEPEEVLGALRAQYVSANERESRPWPEPNS
jgi:hypothetical protein